MLAEWADPRFIHGVARYARQANWHLNFDYIGGRTLPPTWKGDGCINMVESREASNFIRTLNLPQPNVVVDSEGIGRQAADYFLQLGFRNFACYAADYSTRGAGIRLGAYRERVKEAGFPTTSIAWSNTHSDDGVEWDARREWLVEELTKLPKPVAVFCTDDRVALRIVEACCAAEIDIPNDIAVLGVGNMEPACECSAVPLSSIRIDFEELGYQRAARLDRMLDGETCERTMFPSAGIEERGSTYTLAVDSTAGRKALRFMLDNFASPAIGIGEICEAGGLARRQLTRITRKELKTSPGRLLEDARIRKSCELLRTTDYPIKRVAYETGLGNALRLQRIFRKRFQTTPTDWRRAVREPEGGIGHTSGE